MSLSIQRLAQAPECQALKPGLKRNFLLPDMSAIVDTCARKKIKSEVTYPQEDSSSSVIAFPDTLPKTFQVDSCPYILTTEIGQNEALIELNDYPAKENGVYVGFAFEFNYHLLAQRPMQMAVICDINARMHKLYDFVAKTIIHCSTRTAFLAKFRTELETNVMYYYGTNEIDIDAIINYYSNKEFSWLSSEERFLQIKSLYQENKIVHLNLNLSEDIDFFGNLKKWMDHKGYELDVVYVSNIPEWLNNAGSSALARMEANLLRIMSKNTIFVDAKRREGRGEPLVRVTDNIKRNGFPSFRPEKSMRKRKHYIARRAQKPSSSGIQVLQKKAPQSALADVIAKRSLQLFSSTNQ